MWVANIAWNLKPQPTSEQSVKNLRCTRVLRSYSHGSETRRRSNLTVSGEGQAMKKLMFALVVTLLLTVAAVAQDVPKFEVPIGFSFVNVHPGLTPITSFNIFGGGGGFVYNVTPWVGIKADFM